MATGKHKQLRGKARLREEATLEAKKNVRLYEAAGVPRSYLKELDLCLMERGIS